MNVGEWFSERARHVASGSLGYGWQGVGALLGLALAREVVAILIGTSIIAAMVLGVFLLRLLLG